MAALNDTSLQLFGYFLVSSTVKYICLRWLSKRKREYELVGRVQAIYSYPIKSGRGIPLKSADCTKHGLQDHGVTDSIHGELVDVVDCGESASKWISEFLDRSNVRIGFSPPELLKRDMSQKLRPWPYNGEEGDAAVFTFSTPYLLVSSSSLQEVNNGLDKPVPIIRFRPNIVIDGKNPFDEDEWLYVKIGNDILFRIVERCRRCINTTIDPATGIKGKEVQPLKHLRSFRCLEPYGTSPLFGVYIAVEKPGFIQIGQPVWALRK